MEIHVTHALPDEGPGSGPVKVGWLLAEEHHRPEVPRRRQAWLETQAALDPARLLFIDETGVTTKMARRFDRAKRCHALMLGQVASVCICSPYGNSDITVCIGQSGEMC